MSEQSSTTNAEEQAAPLVSSYNLSQLPLLHRAAYLCAVSADSKLSGHHYSFLALARFDAVMQANPLSDLETLSPAAQKVYWALRSQTSWDGLYTCAYMLREQEREQVQRLFDSCLSNGIVLRDTALAEPHECVMLLDHVKHLLSLVFAEAPCDAVRLDVAVDLHALGKPLLQAFIVNKCVSRNVDTKSTSPQGMAFLLLLTCGRKHLNGSPPSLLDDADDDGKDAAVSLKKKPAPCDDCRLF